MMTTIHPSAAGFTSRTILVNTGSGRQRITSPMWRCCGQDALQANRGETIDGVLHILCVVRCPQCGRTTMQQEATP